MFALVQPVRSGRSSRSQSLFRRTIRLGFGAILAASLACGSDSTAPEAIEGRYVLQTIGGRSLPVVIEQDESEKFEITAGSFTLSAPNVLTAEFTFRETTGATVSVLTSEVNGTWSRSGATVTLTVDGEALSATLSGGILRIMEDPEDGGMGEWVFRK